MSSTFAVFSAYYTYDSHFGSVIGHFTSHEAAVAGLIQYHLKVTHYLDEDVEDTIKWLTKHVSAIPFGDWFENYGAYNCDDELSFQDQMKENATEGTRFEKLYILKLGEAKQI